MPSKPKPGMVLVSAWLPEPVRDQLRIVGGGNISNAIRQAIEAPVVTPSGAQWIAAPCQLKNPLDVEGPQVIATPAGVMVHGLGPSALVIDAEAGELAMVLPDAGVASEVTLGDLAALAGRLPGALLACCAPDGSANEFGHELPCGLRISRLSHGLVEIAVRGHGAAVALPIRTGLQLAAELLGLLVRRVALHQLSVLELNASLAASEGVEA
jgi:hypothetical protein